MQKDLNTHLSIFCVLFPHKTKLLKPFNINYSTQNCEIHFPFLSSRLVAIWQQDSVHSFMLQFYVRVGKILSSLYTFFLQIRGNNNLFTLQKSSVTSLVGIKEMHVETESPLHKDYIFIYIEKCHLNVENSDDCVIFTVVKTDDCKESGYFLKNIWAGKMDYFHLVALLIG